MIRESQRRWDRIDRDLDTVQNTKLNKVGKKRYVEIKSGKLAEFLAEDMLAFQPSKEKGKDKLTGMNYQALQYSMAYFGQYKEEMKAIFEKSHLINSPIEHPFLQKVIAKSHTNVIKFYMDYLIARKAYLEKCLEEKQYRNYYFLHVDRKKWEERTPAFYHSLAARYLDEETQAIELPRGLFNDAIKTLLEKKHGDHPAIREALSKDRSNTTFLLQTYFNAVLGDSVQEFYHFKRSYKLFNILENRHIGNKLQPVYYSLAEFETRVNDIDEEIEKQVDTLYREKELELQGKRSFGDLAKFRENKEDFYPQQQHKLHRFLHDFKENEKILRLYKVQDILLFLMAKQILISLLANNEIEKYKLSEIMPDAQSDILSVQTPFSITLTKDGSTKTIRQENLKLKNFGDFQRFVRDRRIETLYPYIKGEIIDRHILEKELETYDNSRVQIFELIHRFEESILSGKSSALSGKTYVQFPDILRACPEMGTAVKQQMQIIRNAFCHNSYPQQIEKDIEDVGRPEGKADVPFSLCEEKEIPEIAAYLNETMENTINTFINSKK
jgi:hypothetical protein